MTHIEALISELIAIDPTLAAREAELRKVLHELLAHKPDIALDPIFVAKLREEIYQRLAQKRTHSFFANFLHRPLAVAVASMVVTLLVVAPLTHFLVLDAFDIGSRGQRSVTTRITTLPAKAFGPLAGQSTFASKSVGISERVAAVGANRALPSGLPLATPVQAPLAMPVDLDAKMIAPGEPVPTPTVYEYEYVGALPTLPKEVTVLHSVPSRSVTTDGRDLLNTAELTFFDGQKLQDLKLQNINAVEDRAFGFSLSLDPTTNSVSLSKNWAKWPDPFQSCQKLTDGVASTKCYEDLRLKITDIPADQVVLAAVQTFTQSYGIDTAAYGKPFVDNSWRAALQHQPVESQYVPDEVTVIFPMAVGGKELVYEEWGGAVGFRVSYDVRAQRVSGFSGLSRTDYESSSYAVATTTELQNAIKHGGRGMYIPVGEVKRVTVRLGQPEQILTKTYTWDAAKNMNTELFVPALRFPIIERPKDAEVWFDREAVIVPLAADLYLQHEGGPVPMPLLK